MFLVENTSISWSSKLQKSVALSFCEAEYMTLKEAAKELIVTVLADWLYQGVLGQSD